MVRWKPVTLLDYGGVLGGASVGAVYVFVRSDCPLKVLAFVGLCLVIVDGTSGLGGPNAGVPDREEGVPGELHDDALLVTNLAGGAPPIRLSAYWFGLLGVDRSPSRVRPRLSSIRFVRATF